MPTYKILPLLLLCCCTTLFTDHQNLYLHQTPSLGKKGYSIIYSSRGELKITENLPRENNISLSPKTSKKLKKLLKKIKLSGLKEEYGRKNIRDVPITTIISKTTNQKVIIYGNRYAAAPSPLKDILRKIDALIYLQHKLPKD